jgi:chemotaxis protein CheX
MISAPLATLHLHLNRIISDVLGVMFASSAEPFDGGAPGAGSYTATVGFVGDWRGAVMVRCEAPTAKRLGHRLFKSDQICPDDVADAMGELANMIGGNLKSVLPPGVDLSVPTVALGGDLAVRVCGGAEAISSLYSCEAGDFEVTVVHSFAP